MLTVPEVLQRAGHPIGYQAPNVKRWRTTCPIHHGDNRQAFSYTESFWHCFVCGESGGVVKLARLLGVLTEPPPPRQVEGIPDLSQRDRQRIRPPLSRRLMAEAMEVRARVLADANRIHRACEQVQASELPRWLDVVALDYQNDPDARDAAFETAARWWAEVQRWRDVAHQLYAQMDMEQTECPCQGVRWPERGTRARPRLA